ncbi:MAG: single-stranded-DNA-specific exonuclease RecJ [Candidatus Sumerlaeia bacterium]|nr:single-stranded-DNA-specific exonuclease RecJ [Candidatus Sumerlaeia bacterium]
MANSGDVKTHWRVATYQEGRAATLARSLKLHPIVARVLQSRGWDDGRPDLDGFITPALRQLRPPSELMDMGKGIERVARAIRDGEKIWIYGDYDVDGVTSTALMISVLRFLGVTPRHFIPHRVKDGYGMSVQRVEDIAQEGCDLIVTVDTGITAVEPIRRARELGIDVVVTDHHKAGMELPDAVALINPNRPDVEYPWGRLCGVGVVFKFAHALLRESGRPEVECKEFLRAQLDLVALGTIADVVPLTGENRVLAHFGLPAIMKSPRPGIRALMDAARLTPRTATPDLVSFGLGPRLNAAGRTDSAEIALELLLTKDLRRAAQLAKELENLNVERRRIEDDILGESVQEADTLTSSSPTHALVVGGEGWHLGVVGIVASRLVERYQMPSIVLAIEDGVARRSARSIDDFDLHGALAPCREPLIGFGGHASAAGLRLYVDALPDFRGALNEHAGGILGTGPRVINVNVDAELSPRDLCWELYDDLQKLQPFGEGNPEPVFLMRNVRCRQPARLVGKNQDHLKVALHGEGKDFDGIGFSMGRQKDIFDAGLVDVLVRPSENVFNGSARLEVQLMGARVAEAV